MYVERQLVYLRIDMYLQSRLLSLFLALIHKLNVETQLTFYEHAKVKLYLLQKTLSINGRKNGGMEFVSNQWRDN